jgi:hypothetical protein
MGRHRRSDAGSICGSNYRDWRFNDGSNQEYCINPAARDRRQRGRSLYDGKRSTDAISGAGDRRGHDAGGRRRNCSGGSNALRSVAVPILEGDMAQSAGKMLESMSSGLYNPPVKPPRPFEAGYPGGGIADEAGKLQYDIDGRPLIGAHISGRQVVRGGDEAISPAEYDAISEGSIGAIPKASAAGALPRGAAGAYREIRGADGPERSIAFLKSLNPSAAEKVVAHELGHALDEMSGRIPTAGLNAELRQIYNTLNTGRERTTGLTGPKHIGYGEEEVPRELMAEAIRAYMTDPNYIKTVAPKTAGRIREYVNSNPRLNQTIQFNGVVLPLATGAGAGAVQLVPVDHDPFAD